MNRFWGQSRGVLAVSGRDVAGELLLAEISIAGP